MDIPFLKFALPVAVLYLFYWALIANPWVDESAASSGTQTANGLSADAVRDLVDQSKKLLQEKKYEQALPLMLRVHKAYPESHIYIEHLATIYAALDRFGEEAQMWEQFLQYAPMPAEGCPQIGQAYEKQNKLGDAEKAFERCYIIEPNSDNILFYAHAVEMKGDYKKAAALYEQGVKRSPNYGDLCVGLARVQMFTGQSAKAKERVLAVLKRSPDNVDALLVAGMACTRTGDYVLARKYLEHGLKLSPAYRDLQQAMAHLRASRPPKQALALSPGAKP